MRLAGRGSCEWSGLPALVAGVALGKKGQGKSERQGKVKKGPGHDGSL